MRITRAGHRRKALTVGVVLLTATLSLGACSSSKSASDASAAGGSGHVTLHVDLFGSFGYKEAGLYDEYMKLHPDITIQQSDTQDENQYWQALQTKLAGGGGLADVQGIEVGRVASVLRDQADKFVDLKSIGYGSIDDGLVPWKAAEIKTPDGRILGAGTDIGPEAVCYRTDLFAAAGLPTDRAALAAKWSTWQGYLDLGRQYMAKAQPGNAWTDSAVGMFTAEVGQQQQRYTDASGKAVYATNPAVKAAWSDATTLVAGGMSAKLAEWTPEWNQAFSTGKFATLSCPAWMIGYIKGQAGLAFSGKWDIAPGPGKTGNWGGSYLAIPRSSKHQKEAAALIAWLTAKDQQTALFTKQGSFPSDTAAQAQIRTVTDPYFNNAPIGQIFSESAANMPAQILGVNDAVIGKAFGDALGEVERTGTPPDTAWQHAMDGIQKALGN